LQQMTWNFVAAYADEAHALLYRVWLQLNLGKYLLLNKLDTALKSS